MGKKPLVALVGLVWAGMLAAGCGKCCRNNTREGGGYNPPPTFQSKNTKTPDGQTPDGRALDKDINAPPKPGEGSSITPASAPGKQVSSNLPADGSAPGSVESLKHQPGFQHGGQPADTSLNRTPDGKMLPPLPLTRTTEISKPMTLTDPPPTPAAPGAGGAKLPPIPSETPPGALPKPPAPINPPGAPESWPPPAPPN